MKRTKLRRFLPILLTLLTVIVCVIGITATAEEESTRSNQITHASLVLDNNVDLVFWTEVDENDAQNKETFMTFNDGKSISYSGTKTLDGVTYVIYRYNNLLPQDLGDVISAKLYVNGVLTSYMDYSVKNYCQYILSRDDASESLKTLLSDLLVYAAESQQLVGETEEPLITNSVIGLTPSASPDKMTVLYKDETVADLSRGASASLNQSKLLMTNGVELFFNVELPMDANPNEYTVCMTVNGREQDLKIVSTGYANRVTFKSVYAYELFDQIQVNVYKNSVRVSNSTTFSVAAYLDALSKDPEYTAITEAYYNYCFSSHIYAGTHTVTVPGEITALGAGTSTYDDRGTVTYKCSLCGGEVDTLDVTHLRDYEGPCSAGGLVNNATGGSLFTVGNATETLEDGSSNGYLSIIRDTNLNTGSGSLGYYILTDHARASVTNDITDNYGQYTSNKYTFAFDVKAPENGLTDLSLYLRNKNADSGGARYCEILKINKDGSLSLGTAKIAPAGTISSEKWSKLTITMELYQSAERPCIFLEYYVDSTLVSSFSITNTLRDARFSCLYFTIANTNAKNGQGYLFDNIMFAQGCVHSFSDSVEQYLSKLNNGSLRQMIEMVQNDFELNDFSYVVRWDGKSQATYKEYQSFYKLNPDKYADPPETPTSFEHPRLLFNTSDIPDIVENIEKEANAGAKASFMSLVESTTDGKLQPTSTIAEQAFEHTNYNVSILRAIEAKALYYALYKESGSAEHEDAALRGYQAIYAMKNYILTFDVQWKASDQCRYYGDVMYYAALVYDWCYDLLTDDDKDQFRLGVQNLLCDGTNNKPWATNADGTSKNTHEGRKLEGGFPALEDENQSRLTGHGAEAQVLRDYFSFAVAIFDEDPTWYDYVGGLIYQDYIDARDYFYSSNFYPDGSAGYNCYRYLCDLYNAWIFSSIGVEFPYNAEDMATVVHGLIAMETEGGFQFATADGSGTTWYDGKTNQYRIGGTVADCALISSYLFDDEVALAIAYQFREYKTNFSTSQMGISAGLYLILTSNGLTPAEDYQEHVDNVEYHGGFQEQIVSRNTNDDGGVVVLLQGAQHLPGGHTHQNAGSFQIWYKGMLTRDDGLYDAYGSNHHHYYHMSATAHNTLLIYNPNKADEPTEPVSRVGFYNGGQRCYLGIPATYKPWIADDRFSYGKNIGMQYDDEENPSYVYFANDITNAYDVDTVDYVERSFMTLYTGDEETPMVMFIYDNITSDSPDFQKTFLLQCVTEPTVDKENGVVTVDNGQGKLVLTSLLGGDTIKAYGRTSVNGEVGEGINGDGSERFYLSGAGVNVLPGGATSIGDKAADLEVVWGHVEIQPDANNYTNNLVNVLYVTDSNTTVTATPRLIQGQYLTGASFKNSASVFVNDPMHSSDILSFTAEADEGIETMTYYIGGLSSGDWKVYVDGERIYAKDADGNDTDFSVTEEGKLLTLEAPVGTITLEPGENMRPAGSVGIAFNLNGGKWEGEAPLNYYVPGEGMVLPIPVRAGSTFGGWYTDKEYTNLITEIPKDATEMYRLYAKWSTPILHVDYTQGGSLSNYTQASYSIEAGGGTHWDMYNGKESYFLWSNTGSGSIIGKNGAYSSYADESLQVSFSLSFGRNGSDPLMPLQLYIRDQKSDTEKYYLNAFMTDSSGAAFIGNGGGKVKIGEIASSGSTTFHFVLDFGKGTVIAYNDNGEQIANENMRAIGISLPSRYKTYEEWFRGMTSSSNSLMSLKGTGAGTIRVYGLTILSGSLTESCKNFSANSTMHSWDEGVVIKDASTDSCSPGLKVYTCTDCDKTKTEAIPSNVTHTEINKNYSNGILAYVCADCACSFSPAVNYYLDGTSHDNMIGVGNSANFDTKPGTNQPVLANGAYELLNKTGKEGDIELWVPARAPIISGFSAANSCIGFLSFKVNALTSNSIGFNFVDTSSTGSKWSPEWCLTDSFFNILSPTTTNGKSSVKVTGWDGIELANIDLRTDKSFTDWIDVTIHIEMGTTADGVDVITLYYYINDAYVGSATKEITTSTGAINSFCITGSTAYVGSGIKLDDIAFGYTAHGVWEAAQEQ